MKKKIAILLILCTVTALLAGCGSKLEGTYSPVNSYADFGALTFNGNNVSVNVFGYAGLSGTYQIKGKEMVLTMELLGTPTTQTMSYSKKGDSIFLDGQEYIKQGSTQKQSNNTLLIIVAIIALLAVCCVTILLSKKKPAAKHPTRIETDEWEEVTPQTPSEEWEEVKSSDNNEEWEMVEAGPAEDEWEEVPAAPRPAPPKPTTPPAVKPVAKATPAPAPKKETVRRNVTSDSCCICGAPLSSTYTKLFDHPSGVEARIDKKCHSVIYTLASSKDVEQFDKADQYIKAQLDSVDPTVEKVLVNFLQKAEARVYSDMMNL